MSRERFINKAELVIHVNNTNVEAHVKMPHSGTKYGLTWADLAFFVKTNVNFTDRREHKVMRVTEIDVGKIQAWSLANVMVQSAIGMGKPVNLIYVNDRRTVPANELTAVRLVNGRILPTRGLTVATPNPLYVLGHYNQEDASLLGTTNTIKTKPAALIADAVTVLSPGWMDSKSAYSDYRKRRAQNMTVNAAVLTGIVETSNVLDIYSGGAHNLLRFLEDWDDCTLTYNGSMVVLFDSARATAPFQQPGDYYYPPDRRFNFDRNFLEGKLPPGTPELRAIIRGEWVQFAAGRGRE
jgi:hypothetical protein